ncbi:helix-turn-helix domain-containing protein [Marinospirillum insulare]|uniref:Transcriptional regulator n=1 Tax=Marinospirillum insulare TaxID=217169 RepID=A0ABQ6A113_9GAMM|nr:helix-turn-helix transcriptional regulator [Marinospirillum insulare]GLR64252.1 transcriptional regulator [Marinospirillum insulare]
MDILEREQYLSDLLDQLTQGEISIGQAVYSLRKDVTGLRQDQFARMCKISLRALRQVEYDQGNPTLQTLNNIFKLFGMRMGVIKCPPN